MPDLSRRPGFFMAKDGLYVAEGMDAVSDVLQIGT
jgi:hypothetical protein